MLEFLTTWLGMLIFILFDVLALFVVVAICYRLFCKRGFDILFSGLAIAVTSPAFLWVYLKYRTYKKEGGEVDGFLRRDPAVGKKGKTVKITTFQTKKKDGSVAGEYGKGLQERSLRYLPRLIDVFLGRASFIGLSPLAFEDAAFLDDEQEGRYAVRIGLISPLKKRERQGEPERVLAAESKYAQTYTIFTDMRVFFGWLLSKIRGEEEETHPIQYAKTLCEKEIITQEEYKSVMESAEEERQVFYLSKPTE